MNPLNLTPVKRLTKSYQTNVVVLGTPSAAERKSIPRHNSEQMRCDFPAHQQQQNKGKKLFQNNNIKLFQEKSSVILGWMQNIGKPCVCKESNIKGVHLH